MYLYITNICFMINGVCMYVCMYVCACNSCRAHAGPRQHAVCVSGTCVPETVRSEE
jgi:hypothetical protein